MSGQNIGIAVIIVVAIGAGVWWVASDPAGDAARTAIEDVDDAAPREAGDEVAEEMPSGMGTMRELMLRGEPMECTFSFTEADGTSGEGTSFFDGERVRMDTMMQVDGQTYNASNIILADEMYAWGTMAEGEFAVVMPLEEGDDMMMDDEAPVGVDEEVAYDCRSWSVDVSVFTPPPNIEFMNMGDMMQGMMQGFEGMDPEAMQNMSQEEMEAMMQEMQGQMMQ